MPYCDVERVRLVTGLESDDISDAELRDLRDSVATPELNSDINQKIKNEKLDYVSDDKENDVDGSNKTFYLEETHDSFRQIGDLNDDGVVDKDDVEAYYIDGSDNRQTLTVTSIVDADNGEIKLEKSNGNALASGDVSDGPFATYVVAPTDVKSPARSIETACAELTGAYAFTNIEASKLKNFSIGDVSINRQAEGYATMRDRYSETLKGITQSEMVQSGENVNKIRDVF